MKDFHLRFPTTDLGNAGHENDGWYDNEDYAIFDLINGNIEDVPDIGGGYVLGTADGTMLVYPWGTSPIFYIGKATGLRRRLQDHRKALEECIADHASERSKVLSPRYVYGAAFGAHAVWYLAGKIAPPKVEEVLMASFRDAYGSIPVANGQQNWSGAE